MKLMTRYRQWRACGFLRRHALMLALKYRDI
jgi:hypothetical protein